MSYVGDGKELASLFMLNNNQTSTNTRKKLIRRKSLHARFLIWALSSAALADAAWNKALL
eukprot:m.67320 g.67320  ORF g.67320 m.67320 type:complete len:60 (+) comp49956_c0_seq3:167-346(+)